MTRQRLRLVALAAIVTASVGAALLPLTAERGAPREITLVIRNMAFEIEGDAAGNPSIHLARGESVVLTVRNEDAGFVHDFAIPDWQVSTRRLRAGESARLLVSAPPSAGTAPYVCTPHSSMMAGRIVVQ